MKKLLAALGLLATSLIPAQAQNPFNPDFAWCNTRGAITTRFVSAWDCLTPGTSGYVLTTQGPGADVVWAPAPGLSSIANNRLIANVSGGAAVPIANSLSDIFDSAAGSTQGLLYYRSATQWQTLLPGNNGDVLVSQGAGANLQWRPAGAVLSGYIDGLQLEYFSTTQLSVQSGMAAADDASTYLAIAPATAIVKAPGTAWAVGSSQGCLDTGSPAILTWYHVFVIRRSDTGVVDVLCSTSPTAPTMPANYDSKRRIGSVRTFAPATNLFAWYQYGDTFLWQTAIGNTGISYSSAGTTVLVPTPLGISTQYVAAWRFETVNNTQARVTHPNKQTAGNFFFRDTASGGTYMLNAGVGMPIYTNDASQVYVIGDNASTDTATHTALGWIDARGKNCVVAGALC